MENWIVALIIIGTVLACWSFSLLLRLISEFVARKRKRLHTEYQRAGVIRALIAMLLGLVGAVVSGWFAFDIAQQTGGVALDDAGIVFAVTVGLSLFALMLIVWASIGDRARGRLRCPRCWYDMEGIDTPQCPECGKAIKNPKNLRKARRTKWPFALASVCIGVGVYGFANIQRVGETDRLALVPTWVLMMGWEVLPEDWILEENSSYTATLEYRLMGGYGEYKDWLSDARKHRFNVRLCRRMLDSIESRWDPRRLTLIHRMTSLTHYVWIDSEWINTEDIRAQHIPIDARRLLALTVEDVIEAINAETPSELQVRILESSPYSIWLDQYQATPTAIAPILLVRDIEEDFPPFEGRFVDLDAETRARIIEQRDERAERALRTALDPLIPSLESARFRHALLSDNDDLAMNALYILDLSRRLTDFADVLLSTETGAGMSALFSRAALLSALTRSLEATEINSILTDVLAMLSSDDRGAQNHAACVIYYLQLNGKADTLQSLEIYQACIQHIATRFIGQDDQIYPDASSKHWTRNTIALQIIANHDVTGKVAYPLLENHLLNDTQTADDLVQLNLSDDPEAQTKHIRLWVEHFAHLASSDKQIIREWVIENLPIQRGTEHDTILDSITLGLIDDNDEYIREVARQRMTERVIMDTNSVDD